MEYEAKGTPTQEPQRTAHAIVSHKRTPDGRMRLDHVVISAQEVAQLVVERYGQGSKFSPQERVELKWGGPELTPTQLEFQVVDRVVERLKV